MLRAVPVRLALLALVGFACGRPGAERRRVLRSVLVAEEARSLARDPAAVREKWDRMARSPYDYFRGTAAIFERDLARGGFLVRGKSVALAGDPHPENLGPFRDANGEWTLEWNDFDRARFGPFTDDVVRLGVGFFVAGQTAGLGPSKRDRVVRKVARGWADEIANLAHGDAPVDVRPGKGFGRIVEDLFAEARRLETAPGAVARGASIPAPEADRVRAILVSSRRGPPPVSVGMERVRSGVASRALERWRVRLEGASPAPEDDVVVEVKEVQNRAPQRVVDFERAYQRRDLDPWLALGRSGAEAFVVRSLPPWRGAADVDRIADRIRAGTWKYRDLREFAHVAGRLLARGHALTPARDGKRPLRALARAVGDGEAFVEEMVDRCDEEGERTLEDYRLFRALLRKSPLLGED